MASSDEGWKRMRSWSSVIRRVLEGGVGCESGGILERSMESDGREDDREEERLLVDAGIE
jgi:hypothetical protein